VTTFVLIRHAAHDLVGYVLAGRKLDVPQTPLDWFDAVCVRYELREVPLDARTACAAASLPPIHRDPFDRVLAALAQFHNLTVLTSDRNIPKYPGVKSLWRLL